eukprot:GHVT01057125.1.p1 GENE.GHVT01057125.1~~GHVT01057125.1.p1  ORF type:complete len:258 (+),score=35.96 GHVT01057125.1:77-775(+)
MADEAGYTVVNPEVKMEALGSVTFGVIPKMIDLGQVALGHTDDNLDKDLLFRISFGKFVSDVNIDDDVLGGGQLLLDIPDMIEEVKKGSRISTCFRAHIAKGTDVEMQSEMVDWSATAAGMIVVKDAVPIMTEFCLGISKIKEVNILEKSNTIKRGFTDLSQALGKASAHSDVQKAEGKVGIEVILEIKPAKLAYDMWQLKLELQGKMYETKCAKNEGKEAKLGFVEPIGEI